MIWGSEVFMATSQMKRGSLFVIVAVLSAALCSCVNPLMSVQPPLASRADEVAAFKPIKPDRWVLPNGMTVLFLQDSELPIVHGRLFVRGGSLWGPEKPVGGIGAMGELMRQGGAAELSSDALDSELEKLAATIGTSFGAEFGAGNFSCLSSDFDRVFDLFSKVILKPRFDADRIALWKGQAIESIRRRVEDPGTVATIAFTQLLYGDTAYGRITKEEDIHRISRTELLSLHRSFVRPDGAVLVITGRIDKAAVEDVVARKLGTWEPRGTDLPAPPPIEVDPKPGIYFIELPFSQATIQAGQLGVPRLTPDYPAIEVFNDVFGASGFGSRLMKRVRTELGLTYGVYGGIAPAVVRGINYFSAQTKAESVGEATVESINVLIGMQQADPTEAELAERKAAIRNSFVFNFESADSVAGRIARLELLNFPFDYDETYLTKIDQVQPTAVTAVARDRWDSTKFVVVVVGNESAYSHLTKMMQESPGPLKGFELIKLGFDQAIKLQ
jgi:zinc protease